MLDSALKFATKELDFNTATINDFAIAMIGCNLSANQIRTLFMATMQAVGAKSRDVDVATVNMTVTQLVNKPLLKTRKPEMELTQ